MISSQIEKRYSPVKIFLSWGVKHLSNHEKKDSLCIKGNMRGENKIKHLLVNILDIFMSFQFNTTTLLFFSFWRRNISKKSTARKLLLAIHILYILHLAMIANVQADILSINIFPRFGSYIWNLIYCTSKIYIWI